MRTRWTAAAAAIGLTLFGGQALAQEAATDDTRCILIGLLIASQKDGALPGSLMVAYFQGRIESRDPNAKLVEMIRSEAEAMDKMADADKQAVANRCIARMNETRKTLEGLQAK